MRASLRVVVFVTMMSLGGLVAGQGNGESEPDAENVSTDKSIAQEAAGTETDVNGSADSASSTDTGGGALTDGLIPMDDETAEVLFGMGIYPFQDRIPAEDFELANLEGDEVQLLDHVGEIVFLNFWATWCGPCREEMPSMQTLYEELHDEGLEILAVNVREDRDTAKEFVDEFGFTYPILLDRDGRVMLRYGIRAYPTTYIVDRKGYVLGVRPGYHDWATDDVVAAFRALLAQ